MECTVTWTGAAGAKSAMSFMAETGSGHIVHMDGAPNPDQPGLSGGNLAARPMELLLVGAGGCSSFDVVMILKRGRHDIRGCQVKVTGDRADVDPKVYTTIHMHYVVTGKGLPQAAVERAVQLSHEKFCSATIMLAKTANITHSLEVIEAA